MVRSKSNGHSIMINEGLWVYSDDKTPVGGSPRCCGNCREQKAHDNETDICLGLLPGVANACCGHGDDNAAYVQLLDGSTIRGPKALIIQKILQGVILRSHPQGDESMLTYYQRREITLYYLYKHAGMIKSVYSDLDALREMNQC